MLPLPEKNLIRLYSFIFIFHLYLIYFILFGSFGLVVCQTRFKGSTTQNQKYLFFQDMKQDILQFAAIAQLLAYKDVKSIPIPYAFTQMFLKPYFIYRILYETDMIL